MSLSYNFYDVIHIGKYAPNLKNLYVQELQLLKTDKTNFYEIFAISYPIKPKLEIIVHIFRNIAGETGAYVNRSYKYSFFS